MLTLGCLHQFLFAIAEDETEMLISQLRTEAHFFKKGGGSLAFKTNLEGAMYYVPHHIHSKDLPTTLSIQNTFGR